MSRKDYKYGVSRTSILVYGLSNTRKPTEERTALIGSVVKIEGTIGSGNVVIKFLDKTGLQFEESTFYGKQSDFIPIAERLWPLLVAMPSLVDRVSVASNGELCDAILGIQVNNSTDVFYSKICYPALVKYIGPVEAMGAGYYLGLEIVSRIQITKCDGSYAGKSYFSALPGTALFVSIDKIRPVATYLASRTKRYEVTPDLDVRMPTRNVDKIHTNQKNENEMDLIELIGGSWPGVTDNKLTSNSTATEPTVKVVRNKSINPMSHLMNGKKIIRVAPKNEAYVINNANTKAVNTEPEIRTKVSDVESTERERDSNTTYDTPALESSSGVASTGLSVGTLVEVWTDISSPLYGVVRWVGGDMAGVELEEDQEHLPLVLTDGTHNGQRHFSCTNNRALFVPVSQCQPDSRFDDAATTPKHNPSKMFGQVDSPIVCGAVPPLSMPTEEDVSAVCGKYRGIQGHHNSCYLDATLFAMFTYTAVFDSLLFRPQTPNDITQYEEVQRVLREEIVNPLRLHLYVRADRVMKLRTLLEEFSSVSGLTSEEKDPEEFLNSLLAQILKAEPFLKLSSGQEAFYYQLFVEKDEGLALPSVQQLFEQSFLSSDIKLKEVPSCLIIQMPRFGKNFKMYPRILPSQLLDVTDIIENSPRQCTVCGALAAWECRECFGQCGAGLESTGFCSACLEKAHAHTRRSAHAPRSLRVPPDFAIMAEHCPPPRLYMELFAVVCIETSHYVAFVKCGSGHEAPWCFFDSMADRKGEQNGYNIPEMVACPDVSTWLSDDGAVSRLLHDTHPHDKQLPEHARRLLCDAYICMYQSPDVMMYR